mmetsp:Transcript_1204/g.1629  ORF Transcript_1204/g.1629 Transcript_1204/m.1629 type:complete len:231 (-) Transcript_1204:84-776(-)|eukprot:CAMPEP_0202450902 /NCGR_PEP_ID=MMETSP1360-20130828/9435_1 /ASSEMBLY_ACC=CAM_ASM_000848 /TAXON_ID=515479 /ORGANISM="Licmophora paradoxa, Strain CCMP2313" /LENGTH=230 /DNA_ID=CAMNT_0049069325 /DNA_START=128 /DNA_END=820 /DNA_ORIENTATION=-
MKFTAGDHVCLPRGHTGTIKHHAICVTSETSDGWMEIVEFGVFDQNGKKKLIAGHGLDILGLEKGEVRKNRVNTKQEAWRVVTYSSSNFNKRDTAAVRPDAQVVNAAIFLLNNGSKLLPPYHITFANGECVARWCKTGRFESIQADNLYDGVNKAEKVSRVLPIASMATKKKSASSATQKKSGGAALGAAAIATVVTAAGSMINNRKEKVANEWGKTNLLLDQAYTGAAQ